MLSLSEEEVEKEITAIDRDMKEMMTTLKKMKEIHGEVSEEAVKEEVCVWLSVNYC